MRSPRIAVNCDVMGGARRKATVAIDYLHLVVEGGGTPVIVPPVELRPSILDHVDAVLFTGGDDYRLGNHAGVPNDFEPVDPIREQVDLTLARETLRRDLPFLGVCAGFQLVVLAAGGRLIGDLPTETPGTRSHKRPGSVELEEHDIDWCEPWRPVAVTPGRYRVNSHHHQGVAELPGGWSCLARAEDGVIEAARGPGRFQLGVQWHPERDRSAPLNRALSAGLIAAAADRGNSRR